MMGGGRKRKVTAKAANPVTVTLAKTNRGMALDLRLAHLE